MRCDWQVANARQDAQETSELLEKLDGDYRMMQVRGGSVPVGALASMPHVSTTRVILSLGSLAPVLECYPLDLTGPCCLHSMAFCQLMHVSD
jgi:hypothetical protein